jgi:hypothetical protein
MRRVSHLLAALLLLLSWGAGRAGACDKQGQPKLAPAFVSAWKAVSGDRVLNLEADRIILSLAGEPAVLGLIRQDGDCLALRRMGIPEAWSARLSGGLLRLEPKDSKAREKAEELAGTYRRLDQVPEEVRLEPLPLAAPLPLPSERIQSIQQEITARFKAEQVLMKSPEKPMEKIHQKIKENRAYLTQLLAEVGWIDSPRFGTQISVYAVILAKHTHDLRLMMTILPRAERDLKTPKEGQTFAILYDALQLDLGHKQLYGTQIAVDDQGPFVLPMEESREKVNRRLKDMGLPDLDEYLAVVRQAYPGKEVQIRQDG